ncbi:MAG: HEAT repeat domain-containing protein [Halobacteriaceae archaeon]
MSDGDEDTSDGAELPDTDTLDARLDEAAEALEAAETEADLDEVEATLDDVEADIEAAELPEPEDEDEESPEEELTARLEDLRADLESQRGPYAEDVAESVAGVADTVADTEWTEDGANEVRAAAESFLDAAAAEVDVETGVADDADPATVAERLRDASEAIESGGLDADEDAETIASLVEAADALDGDVEAAEAWDDLSVREKLQAQGFYEVLGEKHKDFPPEWSALKQWEQRDDAEMALLLLDLMGDSEFIERHCLETLERMGNPDALDPMLERAGKRDKPAIRVLGQIGVADEDVLDTLHEYVDADPGMAKTTIEALGKIGSPQSVEPVAQALAADDAAVRSRAARSLGLIGDTRAVEPLSDVLGGDEPDNVRASAAWALVQIGTEEALERAAEYADDRAYIVEVEAQRAADALGAESEATA